MLNTKRIVSRICLVTGLITFMLSTSCATNDAVEEPDEFLSSLDQSAAEVSDDESEQALVTEQGVNDGSESSSEESPKSEGDEDEKEVEDFAIDKNYESFDPAGIVVRFEFDSHELTSETIAALTKIVAGLKKDALARIFVRGHADKQGPEGYNDDLSQRRAKKIQDFLTSNGIDKERLITVHLGENEPLIEGSNVAAYRQNRRGDFGLDYGGGAFSSK